MLKKVKDALKTLPIYFKTSDKFHQKKETKGE
jgi:hypothetical protein